MQAGASRGQGDRDAESNGNPRGPPSGGVLWVPSATPTDGPQDRNLSAGRFKPLREALADPPKRSTLLKIEAQVESFLSDPQKERLEFPPLQSYQRLLVHKVAEYYELGHITPDAGGHRRAVILSKLPTTSRPPQTLRSAVPSTAQPSGPPHEMKIMKSKNSRANAGKGQASVQLQKSEEALSKSAEAKERAYAEARARIFEGQGESAPSEAKPSSFSGHRKGLEKHQDLQAARHDPEYRRGPGLQQQQQQRGVPVGSGMYGMGQYPGGVAVPVGPGVDPAWTQYWAQCAAQGMMPPVPMPQMAMQSQQGQYGNTSQRGYTDSSVVGPASQWNAYQGPMVPMTWPYQQGQFAQQTGTTSQPATSQSTASYPSAAYPSAAYPSAAYPSQSTTSAFPSQPSTYPSQPSQPSGSVIGGLHSHTGSGPGPIGAPVGMSGGAYPAPSAVDEAAGAAPVGEATGGVDGNSRAATTLAMSQMGAQSMLQQQQSTAPQPIGTSSIINHSMQQAAPGTGAAVWQPPRPLGSASGVVPPGALAFQASGPDGDDEQSSSLTDLPDVLSGMNDLNIE